MSLMQVWTNYSGWGRGSQQLCTMLVWNICNWSVFSSPESLFAPFTPKEGWTLPQVVVDQDKLQSSVQGIVALQCLNHTCVSEERLAVAGFCSRDWHPQVTCPAAEVLTFMQAYSKARHIGSMGLPQPICKPEYWEYYFSFELCPSK